MTKADWIGFAEKLNSLLKTDGTSITMTVEGIREQTGSRDKNLHQPGWWNAGKPGGSQSHYAFRNAGIDFSYDCREGNVVRVTFCKASATIEPAVPRAASATIKRMRQEGHASWSNLTKAIRALRGQPHERFGTKNVENSSKSIVRKMLRKTGLSEEELQQLLDELANRQ